jgi:hypothetical protein
MGPEDSLPRRGPRGDGCQIAAPGAKGATMNLAGELVGINDFVDVRLNRYRPALVSSGGGAGRRNRDVRCERLDGQEKPWE